MVARAKAIARIVADANAPVPTGQRVRDLDVSRRTLSRALSEAQRRGWVQSKPGRDGGVIVGPTPIAA